MDTLTPAAASLAPLTRAAVLDGVAAAMPSMEDVARRLWSREELLRYGGDAFAENIQDQLGAVRAGRRGAVRLLCEAVALRIAILKRERGEPVVFAGRVFGEA